MRPLLTPHVSRFYRKLVGYNESYEIPVGPGLNLKRTPFLAY
jgi:hypothetical protein